MARYGKVFKERVVSRLLPPEKASVETVSGELPKAPQQWQYVAILINLPAASDRSLQPCPDTRAKAANISCLIRTQPHVPPATAQLCRRSDTRYPYSQEHQCWPRDAQRFGMNTQILARPDCPFAQKSTPV